MVIKRRQLGSKIIIAELIYVLFFNIICNYLKIPTAISYGIDLLNVLVFALLLTYKRLLTDVFMLRLQYVFYAVLLLTAAAWLTALLNFVPLLLVLWSTRNALRFFPLFFAIILFWDEKCSARFSGFLLWLQIPNLIIGCVQFFIFDDRGDNLGGIFGNEVGCNGYLCVYLFIVVTLIVEKYLHNKVNFVLMCASCFSSLLISAMAELKVAFAVVPLVVVASFMLNKPTLKTFALAAITAMGLVIGVNLIILFFPIWKDSFSSIKALFGVGKMNSGGYNISRFGAYSAINRYFFHDSVFKNIFGLGFGNCEYSRFSPLTSDFFKRWGYLNYRWFSHQMWFLQTGYLGTACYGAFILAVFFRITKMKRMYGDGEGFGSFGQIMCGIMVICFIYNSALISEAGYILFTGLAMPVVYYKNIIISEKYPSEKDSDRLPRSIKGHTGKS